jgi:predicted GIY-YIG superfamily endonuclease
MDNWYVYIIEKQGRLYVGITTASQNRMRQHGGLGPLYTEGPMSRTDAAAREKNLKGWTREKKLNLIARASSNRG